VTSSGGRLSGVQPPPDKLNGLRTAELFLGDPYWDAGLAKAALVLAVPIRSCSGLPQGRGDWERAGGAMCT